MSRSVAEGFPNTFGARLCPAGSDEFVEAIRGLMYDPGRRRVRALEAPGANARAAGAA
jgi:hypothetical protein